jgi:siderophore synthetase component
MAHTITATLYLDQDAVPLPVVRVTVHLDSATLASRVLTPLEAVQAIGVVAPDAPAAIDALQELITRLATDVAAQAAIQAERVAALQAWQDAIALVPPTPDP